MVHELTEDNSIASLFMSELRDQSVQVDGLRFRKNMERLSHILGYEISKSFDYAVQRIKTPLGISEMSLPQNDLVIASILRAGLSMHQGFLEIFDHAENAFVSAYREETPDNSVKVKVEYKACPGLDGKTLLIADPMLATGQSMELVYQALLQNGIPKKIIIASIIASRQAVDHIQRVLPDSTEIWVVAIDPELNEKSYIVPGLGDAGDLAYGIKQSK